HKSLRSADFINLFRLGFDLQMPYLINIIYRRCNDGWKIYFENAYRTKLIGIRERQILEHFICESDWRLKNNSLKHYQVMERAIKTGNLMFVEYFFNILRQHCNFSPNYSIKNLIDGNYKMYEQEIISLWTENFFLIYSMKTFLFNIADIIAQLPNPDWKYLEPIYNRIPYPDLNFKKNLLIYATITNNYGFVK